MLAGLRVQQEGKHRRARVKQRRRAKAKTITHEHSECKYLVQAV